ncbi:hypothetical protein MUY27_00450 [Mucilaginibacter sp. RS28]|uniref:Zf-HC2 domain-containing protein n=1 Tax=Mucilaginibacter straminoryzae TaxID=2932774 RepID=A0A9X2B756_9SPHI|nr:hypothetical protein [Mucilaginibacter straminoryzae]MCJ8208154.1 hypothetical protein [Mucilaginibacter straminoryzae]
MSTTEEKLWNYIDGLCSAEEQQAIARLIETDGIYRRKYEELLALNAELGDIQLDEPPMAFTYNVMEAIRAEEAAMPLKASINKNIIRGIVGFLSLVIIAVIAYAMLSINWSAGDHGAYELPSVKLPNIQAITSSPVWKGFLFFDVVLGLFLFDAYLHKRKLVKQA